ncbi:class I SAM-dependent RNA methyltransferase [Propionibacteriaceae bacterium Y2011]
MSEQSAVGQVVGPLEVGPVAHGGHWVARWEGRVIFVRHTLPGELVRVRITDDTHARFWRGDAVEVITPAADRITPQCPISGPGGCGGCDFQHVSPAGQRELKRAVVAEQLQRLASLDWDGEVEEVPLPGPGADGVAADADDGVGDVPAWRTRMRYFADTQGNWGLRAHRSHTVVPLPDQGCAIAAVPAPDPGTGAVADVVVDGFGDQHLIMDAEPMGSGADLVQIAGGIEFEVPVDGFWQVHPRAADMLAGAVLDGLEPRAGEQGFDLYCGVGLFAAALAGEGVRMWGVESGRAAVRCARRNVPGARFTAGQVGKVLHGLPKRTDLIVLDPPRQGAGKDVIRQVLARRPRAIAYVACDPAALARDLGTAREAGWEVIELRAFDLFPMTHHVECVAILAQR